MTEREIRQIAEEARAKADTLAGMFKGHVEHCAERHTDVWKAISFIRWQIWAVMAIIVGGLATLAGLR